MDDTDIQTHTHKVNMAKELLLNPDDGYISAQCIIFETFSIF